MNYLTKNSIFGDIMPSHNDLANYGLKRLRKVCSSDLDELMTELHFLIDSGYYHNLLEIYYNWKEPVPLLSDNTTEIALESSLLVMAAENLKNFPVKFLSDLIDYNTFYFFFPFLEWIYSMNLGRQLTAEDVRKIFKNDIGERIVFALEDFDKINEISKPTPEFFQKLRKLKWKNRQTKKIYNEVNKIVSLFIFKKYSFKESSFSIRQEDIVLFLAGCSAVNKEKEKIDEKDVIRAYKTLFKIIKTDISKFID
ncbi:MAG: hypothetical protein PQ975_02815 [Methanobacterium sp.]|jgi:hypothetical protein